MSGKKTKRDPIPKLTLGRYLELYLRWSQASLKDRQAPEEYNVE
jgi:hypothetical protein